MLYGTIGVRFIVPCWTPVSPLGTPFIAYLNRAWSSLVELLSMSAVTITSHSSVVESGVKLTLAPGTSVHTVFVDDCSEAIVTWAKTIPSVFFSVNRSWEESGPSF